ncbi:hypothetical protein ISN44_As07g011400 [Arabidopsis suecica]|uniref:Uncharacterized protein n=1 Tax=Arabidopsis suecica TaxID=45249 RepID=A0A8T2BMT9_ARASU|nr:hypothetical protein ISN44_As07g011400 [Arabidopsis suecica]
MSLDTFFLIRGGDPSVNLFVSFITTVKALGNNVPRTDGDDAESDRVCGSAKTPNPIVAASNVDANNEAVDEQDDVQEDKTDEDEEEEDTEDGDGSENGDMELLEPEEHGAKEQLGDGANGAKEDVALHVSNGPMTRSKTRLLNQAITTLLHQIQGSLKQDACPATLNQAWKFKGIPQPLEVLFDPSSSSPLDLTRFTPPDPLEQTYSSTLTRPLEYTHQITRFTPPDPLEQTYSSTLTRPLEYTHQITRIRPSDHLLDLHLSKNSPSASCFRSISRSAFKGHRSSTKIILSGIRATSDMVNAKEGENCSKLVLEALTATMTKMLDERFEVYQKRKEQELKPKPPDNSLRSTRSSLQKNSYTSKSKSVLYCDSQLATELYKFSGKRDYLEWEKNMDEWFYYHNFLSEKRLACAISQLTGDAYKWWVQEVDDRWYYKEPPITSWRDLKKLLRNKYAPQAPNRTPPVNATVQELAVREKKPVSHQYSATKERSDHHEKSLAPKKKKENARSNSKAEEQFKDEVLKILNTYNKPEKAKCALPSTSEKAKFPLPTEIVNDTCDLPEKPEFILEDDQACEKLTQLEPVHPSSIVSISQVTQEEPKEETQRGLSLVNDMEQLPKFMPKPVLMPSLCDYQRKHYYVFELSTSSIMHLFCPMSVQKGTGALEKHKHIREMAIKEKPPDLHQPQSNYMITEKKEKGSVFQKPKQLFFYKETLMSLTNPEQVIPSKIKCLLQEFEENNPGGLPPFYGLEHQFLDESGESSKTFLYIIQRKQGKKHVVTDTTTQRYEFLAIPNDRLLDFEQAKESYDSHDGIKDVFQPYDQFTYRTKGFMLDKIKLFELNCFLNDSMFEFDNLSRIAYCISYVKTKEVFSVSNPFTEGFDILVYNQIFDEQAKYLKSYLDDLSKNLFAKVKKYTFCTYDPVFRVFVVKAQVIQSEGMKAHAPETWLFNLWLMRFTVQVDYDPCEQLRNEQDEWQGNKRQCRMIFDPGGCFWIQMKCFPNNKQIQLTPRSNFPFQIFEPTREKAYDQSLQGKYNLSLSFNFSYLIPFVAEEADLRTNLFQEGGDDVIMDSSENGDMELLEPEEHGAKEQLGDGANGAKEDVALHVSNGPMTRSKTRLLNQAITTLLHQIQGSLKQDACPATLNQAWKFKGIPQPLEVLFDPSSSSPLDLTRFTPPDPLEQTYSSTLTRPLEYTHQITRFTPPDPLEQTYSSTLTRPLEYTHQITRIRPSDHLLDLHLSKNSPSASCFRSISRSAFKGHRSSTKIILSDEALYEGEYLTYTNTYGHGRGEVHGGNNEEVDEEEKIEGDKEDEKKEDEDDEEKKEDDKDDDYEQ